MAVRKPLTRLLLRQIQLASDLASLAACRIVRLTGKSSQVLHPKLLLDEPYVLWYLQFVRPGERVLDLGAGTAVHAMHCVRAGARVVAADLSAANLAKARSLARGEPAVAFVRCDASAPLPFRNESFSAILLLDVLEHLASPEAALGECARVLKPQGWIAISVPNCETTWKKRLRRAGLPWMSDRDHKREFTWPQVVQMVESANLRIEEGPQTIALDTPLKGLIDLIGGFSLRLYRRLTDWRVRQAARKPQESTGWRCIATKR